MFYTRRWLKLLLLPISMLLTFPCLAGTIVLAQEPLISVHEGTLPDAPEPQASRPAGAGNPQAASGSLTGTVLDTNRDVLQGARVTVAGRSGSAVRTVESGMNGQFAFTGLPPDIYTLTVTAPGMNSFTSPRIPLRAGQDFIVPSVTLAVSAVSTSVTVTAETKEELSEQQVQIAEGQRVAGVFPNFYSTFDWNAPPMQAKQKFQLSIRSIIDPVSFLTVAGVAGAEQYRNIFPAYGSGIVRIRKTIRGRAGESCFRQPAGPGGLPCDLPSRSTLLL